MTKSQQLELILATNPAPDNIHTWVRSEDDIHTFKEVIVDYDPAPDYTVEIMKCAAERGIIKVYSSNPIVPGTFVTPSQLEAKSYSGGDVFEKLVGTDEIAWIDAMEGMYTGR